ncbi:MAG TPA: hypothetical protein VIF14_14895 [Alphaproteobacteria bacterium]
MNRLRRTLAGVLLLAAAIGAAASAAAETVVPRVVIGLYNGGEEATLRRSRLHRLVEMPLNHLGLVLIPHDVRNGLPSEETMRDARGIVTWFTNTAFGDAQAYLTWLDVQTQRGKKLVIFDHIGVDPGELEGVVARKLLDRVLGRIGLHWENEWVRLTYASRIVNSDPAVLDFERKLPPLLPPYQRLSLIPGKARSFLSVRRIGRNETDQLIVAGPAGGYAGEDMSGTAPVDEWTWFINPFEFLRAALSTDDVPKLDTTTLAGRRIYYSHVDGDGWHNISSVEEYRGKKVTSAEVLYEEIVLKYPDLPVTIGPITGDLDPAWYGDESARKLARKMFALPRVEAGSHTHSHPFAWGFFRNPDPRREKPFLKLYPARPGHTQRDSVWRPEVGAQKEAPSPADDDAIKQYQRPRSYAVKPFDIRLEIGGSLKELAALMPPGKRVAIMQWSGDTAPFERALELTAAAGVRNINGGDPRMDGVFRSYGQVSPLGLRVGHHWQVYSSGGNENIYTENWRARFYGYRSLVETLRNVETPIRIKPINVYYHFYSAEREDALNALRYVLEYARSQEIAPITTSRFASMVDGFYAARVVDLGGERWRIENRDGLETVRFDRAVAKSVDFARSEGVVGQRHHQGSLYVALDPAVEKPVVALRANDRPDRDPDAPVAYLISARWPVAAVERDGGGWRFRAQGFGTGTFAWKTPAGSRFTIEASDGSEKRRLTADADAEGRLEFTVPLEGERGVDVAVRRVVDTQ